jgi:hypothetical protein
MMISWAWVMTFLSLCTEITWLCIKISHNSYLSDIPLTVITNSIWQFFFLNGNSCSAIQEMPHLLWNLNVPDFAHKSWSLPWVKYIQSTSSYQYPVFKIHFDVILQCKYAWFCLLFPQTLPKDAIVETDIHKSSDCILLQLPYQQPNKLCGDHFSDVHCLYIPMHQLNISEILHDSKSKKWNGCWNNLMWCIDFWTVIEVERIILNFRDR